MKTTELKNAILSGKLFIYPTDTIYGLGCDATNIKSVAKIKKIKKRDKDKPLSVIAPSISWIKENCIIEPDLNLDKYLPGAYTIVLKKKNKDFLNQVSSLETIGIRIPDCEFTKQIQKANVPFITTSVNLSGEKPAVKISEISKNIKNKADFIIKAEDESKLSGKPSALIINGKEVERS